MTPIDVTVRNTFNTYTASCKGRLGTPTEGAFPAMRASCTAGPEHAVRALARKLLRGEFQVELISREGFIEKWRVSA